MKRPRRPPPQSDSPHLDVYKALEALASALRRVPRAHDLGQLFAKLDELNSTTTAREHDLTLLTAIRVGIDVRLARLGLARGDDIDGESR